MRVPEHTRRRVQAHQAETLTIGAFSGIGSDGGPQSPLNGRWMVTPRSADADNLRSLPRLRAESRQLRDTNPLAAGPIETARNRVVGTGLQPVFAPALDVLGWTPEQGAAWSARVANEFSLWADTTECTLDVSMTFYEWQASVLEARLTSGDCFTNLPDAKPSPTCPYRLRLQLLEADRCGNPDNTADSASSTAGVRRNQEGAPDGYFIYRQHPGNIATTSQTARYAGDWITRVGPSGRVRILHHYRPRRPEETRGVPWLRPVIQVIKDLGRFTEAEITAAVINAYFTTFIKTKTGALPPPVHGAVMPSNAAQAPELALAPGAVIGLAPDEDIATADPSRPNPNAQAFIEGMLTLIGMGLGIPFELLVKKFNSSYSASRAALLDAWFHFRTERAWLVNSACQPVLQVWMAEAVAIGRIDAPGFFADPLLRWAYTRAAWHGDSQGSINLKDEVEAYREAIDGRLMTHERASWELFGSDWTRTFPTMQREHTLLSKAGMLPVPKAGAAAPAKANPQAEAAHDQLSARLNALEARPQSITVPAPAVHVTTGATHVHLDEGMVQLEAKVQAPTVHVTTGPTEVAAPVVHLEATVPPAQVVVAQPKRTVATQTVAHNEAGEIASVTTVTEVHEQA